MSNPKPRWGGVILHYLVGSLMLLDALWLFQLHSYTWAIGAALASVVVLGSLLRRVL